MTKTIFQGAEAIIILDNDNIIKKRIKKSYRIPQIDEKIRKLRTRHEAKLLQKAGEVIFTPKIKNSDERTKEITMDFIDGEKLSDFLDEFELKKQKQICRQMGEIISKLHDAEIIHGDLTTSNMILCKDKIYIIDFGLGYISSKFEDRAVDLHLLKQAMQAKHFKYYEILIKEILTGYKKSKQSKVTLERLKIVEKRGRYKH
jgi:TP53 regulating kinase-like protein